MLPWHVIEANAYMAEQVRTYKYDILDLHYPMKFLIEEWGHDGIHWTPSAYRFMTNTLLTHIALCEGQELPKIIHLDKTILRGTQVVVQREARNKETRSAETFSK